MFEHLDERLRAYCAQVYAKAQAGDGDAASEVGKWYRAGEICVQDGERAFYWFTRAAQWGDATALVSLGHCYLDGTGTRPSTMRARALFERAAAEGAVEGLTGLGHLCLRKKRAAERRRAVPFLREAIARGSDLAVGLLAGELQVGKRLRKDLAESTRLYELGARLGNPWCARELAVAYEEGLGVRRSPRRAFAWMTVAAKERVEGAMHALGYYYDHGFGTRASWPKAMHWYRKSFVLWRDPTSAYNIGLYYLDRGTPRATRIGRQWLGRAADRGHAGAQQELDR